MSEKPDGHGGDVAGTAVVRTFVYVDGFNLHYRAVRGTPHQWLDVAALCDRILGRRHVVARVRYFTARVSGRGDGGRSVRDQQAFLDAMAADERVVIHFGQFRNREKTGQVVRPPSLAGRIATIRTSEEKGSDVNLATWALVDAYEGETSSIVVVSNDSDLVEPVRMLQRLGVVVGVVNPARGRRSGAIPADFVKTVRPGDLARCQLPDEVRLSSGRTVRKPQRW